MIPVNSDLYLQKEWSKTLNCKHCNSKWRTFSCSHYTYLLQSFDKISARPYLTCVSYHKHVNQTLSAQNSYVHTFGNDDSYTTRKNVSHSYMSHGQNFTFVHGRLLVHHVRKCKNKCISSSSSGGAVRGFSKGFSGLLRTPPEGSPKNVLCVRASRALWIIKMRRVET